MTAPRFETTSQCDEVLRDLERRLSEAQTALAQLPGRRREFALPSAMGDAEAVAALRALDDEARTLFGRGVGPANGNR